MGHNRAMRILVLGGTQFVGRHLVEALLATGHEVTVFHRGRTAQGLFEGATEVLGNRDGELDRLGEGTYDWVVDTCGYVPRVVQQSVDAWVDRCSHYLFISTVSVYEDFSQPGLHEESAVRTIEDPETEEIDARTYGALKALCEQRVLDAFGDRAFVPRPGIIAGPYDPTDRFPYWVQRASQSEPFLMPDSSDQPLQLIDARDLAAWCVRQIEAGAGGVFNTAGSQGAHTLGSMWSACLEGTPGHGMPRIVGAARLLESEVRAGQDLPLWVPDADMQGLFQASSRRAEEAGLVHRSLTEVARDTWAWMQTWPKDREWRVGLTPEREQELLEGFSSSS